MAHGIRRVRPLLGQIGGPALVALLAVATGRYLAAQSPAFEPVTDATLLNPSPNDWLNYRRTLDGWGYSPLDQINTQNVNQLQLVWSWALAPGISQATPLVYKGVMYIPDGGGTGILALNAVTGDLLWDFHKEFEPASKELSLLDPSRRRTRNIAIFGDRIYWATDDAHLIALNAQTGAVIWDRTMADFRQGFRVSSGPIVVRGKIVSGMAGCDRFKKDPCFISAYDAQTGQLAWKTSTIARPGEPGGDTWGDVPLIQRAGGDAWIPGSYDPRLNLIYWATSQAKPFTRFQRGTDARRSTRTVSWPSTPTLVASSGIVSCCPARRMIKTRSSRTSWWTTGGVRRSSRWASLASSGRSIVNRASSWPRTMPAIRAWWMSTRPVP